MAAERNFFHRWRGMTTIGYELGVIWEMSVELLTFKEAIEAKEPIICDYKFVTISISEREIRDLWNDNKYLRISSDELDEVATRSLAAGLALRP